MRMRDQGARPLGRLACGFEQPARRTLSAAKRYTARWLKSVSPCRQNRRSGTLRGGGTARFLGAPSNPCPFVTRRGLWGGLPRANQPGRSMQERVRTLSDFAGLPVAPAPGPFAALSSRSKTMVTTMPSCKQASIHRRRHDRRSVTLNASRTQVRTTHLILLPARQSGSG